MNITLDDGRTELWQWDTGRKIIVDDKSVSEVHYSKYSSTQAITREVINGKAEIPNFLLQDTHAVTAYAYSGSIENGYTMAEKTFNVVKKPKPANYVETEEDKAILAKLKEEIGDLSELQTEAKDNLVAAINEAAASGGADWNQNDPTAKDYIKNRPGGYDVATPEKIISEWRMAGSNYATIELSEPLVKGRSYRLTFSENADYSNPVFDSEVVASIDDDSNKGSIYVTVKGYASVIQPSTYPEDPAYYTCNNDVRSGYCRLIALTNTETVKIPNKYIINSDFIITATITPESPETVTLDKTFDQIQEAIRDGKRAVIHLAPPFESENVFNSLQLSENVPFGVTFSGVDIGPDGVVYGTSISINKKNKIGIFSGSAPAITPDGMMEQVEMSASPTSDMQIATKKYVDDKVSDKELILSSSTAGSTKKFKLTIDDTGTLTASEITA